MIKPDLLTFADGKTAVASPAQWEKRRQELLDILEREEYGIQPPFSGAVKGELLGVDKTCCAGHAVQETIRLSFDTPAGTFSFPMEFVYPADGKPRPLVVLLNFHPGLYERYCPLEEIIDSGFSLAYIYYKNVTSDDGDMTNGLAGCYPRKDPATDWGKLSMWAFAASRALDYLLTRPEADTANAAVAGHSRLGKAALLCAAKDTRFRFCLANASGCGGDALEQTKHAGAEDYAHMDKVFPFWFCGNRSKYTVDQTNMPYDQHFLMAAIAPRYVATGSAEDDLWADPHSQQLCCAAASPAWKLFGKSGFVGGEEKAKPGDRFEDGDIAYHHRSGVHFFSRQDWACFMRFVKRVVG